MAEENRPIEDMDLEEVAQELRSRIGPKGQEAARFLSKMIREYLDKTK